MQDKYSKVDPTLQRIARKLPAIHLGRGTLWLFRLISRIAPAPRAGDGVVVENLWIASGEPGRQIRLRVFRPQGLSTPAPALLWLHGGGYLIGRPEFDDQLCGQYVRELGITVVSVDYRLAPEHPYPAGLEDAYCALKWLQSADRPPAVDVSRVAVGGASAGGGLAAALAQLAHDRGECKLCFQLLIYPMLDDRTALRADTDRPDHIMWSRRSNVFGWQSYLGKRLLGSADIPSHAAPARRSELTGLPPAWIGVGTEDLFHDEDVAYVQALKACGVECDLDIVAGAFHGFEIAGPQHPLVLAFRQAQLAALRKYLLH